MMECKMTLFLLLLSSVDIVIVTGNPLPWLFGGPCDSSPCKNGGKCTEVPFTYTCTCADGWKGGDCSVKVKPCESSPCEHGGNCTNKDDETFACSCKDGYLGETCSERVQCENPLDLMFLVDTASWQYDIHFNEVPKFMSNLVDWLKISDRAVEAGVITFTYKYDTKVNFLPGAYSNADTLQEQINKLKKNTGKLFYGSEGYIAYALKLANDEVFKTAEQNPNAAKAILLMTPQAPVDSKSDAVKEAEKLKAKGVKIVTIDLVNPIKEFLTDQSVYRELEKISSPLKPIEVAYDKLDGRVRKVADLLCSFTKDPCEDITCDPKKICTYDRTTTSCVCNETDCEAKPCDKLPCKNDGECENIDEESFKCKCTENWTGETCVEKVLPCESSPCKNSGECENVDENTFKCNCTEGWIGETCEEEVHPCDKDESPCKNGAVCEKIEKQFVCKCTEGWKGETCEEKVLPCESNPCKNSGECENVDETAFKCTCTSDWTGLTCEEKVHPCDKAESPCKNEGTCEKNGDEFVCQCNEDWTGPTCEVIVHPCDKAESPCKNEGICEEDGDEFVCKCNEDWTGPTCEEKVHHCDKDESPCKNEGTCEKNGDEFVCKCNEDWTGPTCEEKVHPCDKAESPCKNNGTCEVDGDEFDCECNEDWTGPTCEEKVHHCDKAESPCKNEGICEKNGDEFVCECNEDWTGPTCEEKVHHCDKAESPCKNEGICEKDGDEFVCECNEDWTGPTCEEKVHHCDKAESPCKNNGTCVKNGDEFVCECSHGWEGDACEERTNPCEDSPCKNGATCRVAASLEAVCICPPGLTGLTCEEKEVIVECKCSANFGGDDGYCYEAVVVELNSTMIDATVYDEVTDACVANPCRNGATCISEDNTYSCRCPVGFDGPTCMEEVRPCDSSPCENDAICENHGCQYTCVCREGYTGFLCETKVTPCDSSPCKNGAACENTGSNSPDGYNCKCTPGYEGLHCENEIDPCENNPCKNSGRCKAEGTTYVCECASGYEGSTCETKVHACDADPCKNGAICDKQGDGFKCLCTEGYTGETCEETVNDCGGECKNGGKCEGSICQCTFGFKGDHCEKSAYAIGFYKSTKQVKVKTENLPSMNAMTVCFRVYTLGRRNTMYFMSYAIGNAERFSFFKYGNRLGARVNGRRALSVKAIINDKKCHHVCFAWQSDGGKWSFYKDGKVLNSGAGLSTGKAIAGGGVLSLAQKTPRPTLAVRFVGKINDLNIWNKVLSAEEMGAMLKCGESAAGNVKSWSDFRVTYSIYAKYLRKNVCPGNC